MDKAFTVHIYKFYDVPFYFLPKVLRFVTEMPAL